MHLSTPLVFALASLASAITINQPGLNASYPAGSTVLVNWTTVDTDPTYFSLYLWNFVYWPPTYVPLAIDIPTADRAYPVQIPCDTTPEWGYQISGINGTNVYIIYAQSEKFTVSDPINSTCVDTPAPTTAAASTCGAPSTVYVTVSPTASSSALFHHHHSHHHHSTPRVPTPSPTTTPSSSRYVKPGIVPKTIGWCSDYSHPVTLDKVPTPTDVPSSVSSVAEATATSDVIVQTVTTTLGVAASGDAGCPFY
ncbi:hypothetical protein BO94DRAFT_540620 [Aspergillus sclerotioniger CBS 115572]|uniref:Yeast cell wall synthesis Kre9/Knh1-like N-terminal domain-containing protein n=1 Tax=Aspergillus sclerotioniger CBS 115572 TaxID=1450535 RepID=A0A317UXM4_9EURO|nr:hypothetical protein BO94DRAFT_540620 [Aspergillus sclerotioniger CBS 115572]PWY66495.1 hypothetical protein BO94DRAFT_540620 [Aspergillus sclerotioniger CBS 115572]